MRETRLPITVALTKAWNSSQSPSVTLFRYMPARRLHWKIVVAGGVLTAILFDLGRWVIGLYLAHSTQPTAFGAAASFAALLVWFYYTAQIFLFGAEFTACLGGLRSGQENPTEQSLQSA
jgi:membrane protein